MRRSFEFVLEQLGLGCVSAFVTVRLDNLKHAVRRARPYWITVGGRACAEGFACLRLFPRSTR